MTNKSQNDKSDYNLKELKRRVICEAAARAMLAMVNTYKKKTFKLNNN